MKYEWVAIGDKSTCEECDKLNGKIFEEEDLPDGSEVCLGTDNCRCTAVPLDLIEDPEIDKLLEDVADKMMEGVITDQTTGKRIILSHFEGIEGLGTLSYETISNYEQLIQQYSDDVGTLPNEFYKIRDIKKQIEFLESELN